MPRRPPDPDAEARGGATAYLRLAGEVARRHRVASARVLLRMLACRSVAGLSALEYARFDLHGRPFREIRDYLTKRGTTSLFERVNPPARRAVVDDKLQFHRRCRAHGLPTPDVLAVIAPDGRIDGDEPLLRDFDELIRRCTGRGRHDLVLKPRSDSLGTGVRYVSIRDQGVFDLEDRPIDLAQFESSLRADLRRDAYLVQPFLRSHPHLAALGSGRALGTVRVLAMRERGALRILYAVLRIPAAGTVHDNFGGGRGGNLIAAVDPTTGRLGAARGRARGAPGATLVPHSTNPETGACIEGVVIPDWEPVRALLARAVPLFGELPCLGWDVAVTEQGLLLVEANSNPDVSGGQACLARGARQWLAPLIDAHAPGWRPPR
jgi:hypothetical protein